MTEFEEVYDVSNINKELNENIDLVESIEDESFLNFTEQDYLDWYNEQRKIADLEFLDFEKHRTKTFDEIVEKYKILIGLTGESYNDATKMMFYSLIANQIKTNFFTMDSKKIDLRLNILIQLKSGHGKKNYEYFIKHTIEGLGKSYQEPVSYHPEQFVGKIIVQETKGDFTYTPIFGTLASDFVVLDEAHSLLTRKENEECLRYIRTALDPIGSNTIEKKQVNVPDTDKLAYDPNCTMLMLTQPITKVDESLLLRGSFRRFIMLIIKTTFDERIDARRKSKFLSLKEDVHNRIWERWILFNKKLCQYNNLKYLAPEGLIEKIDDYLDEIGKDACGKTKEVLEYYNTSQFTIKQNIFKMAIIRAVVEHNPELETVTIKQHHIVNAIRDWHLIWKPQVEWIAQQLVIDSTNPIGWEDKSHGVMITQLSLNDNSCELIKLVEIFCNINKLTGTDAVVKRRAYKVMTDLENWGYIKKQKIKGNKWHITLVKGYEMGKGRKDI